MFKMSFLLNGIRTGMRVGRLQWVTERATPQQRFLCSTHIGQGSYVPPAAAQYQGRSDQQNFYGAYPQAQQLPQGYNAAFQPAQQPIPMGHLTESADAPVLTPLKVTRDNENKVRLVGRVQSIQYVPNMLSPVATMVLSTQSGIFLVELVDYVARQARYLQQDMRIAVSGQLVMNSSQQVYIHCTQLNLAVNSLPPGAGGEARLTGPAGRQARGSAYAAEWLLSNWQAGKSLDEMAAEKGGKTTRDIIATSLIDLFAEGSDLDLARLMAETFPSTDPTSSLQLGDMVPFVNSYLQQPNVPLTKDGFPKMTPIREAMMVDAVLRPQVQAQETHTNSKSLTFRQIQLVLAAHRRGVDLLAS